MSGAAPGEGRRAQAHGPGRPEGRGRGGDDWDVIVVGAGPAGAMTARHAARRGLRTLLVERAPFPRWKVCGATLNAHALSLLSEAGLDHVVAACAPVSDLALIGWGRSARVPLAGTVALRRSLMDQALAQAAEVAGVTRVTGVVAELGAAPACDRAPRRLTIRTPEGVEVLSARVVVSAAGLAGPGEPGTRDPVQVVPRSRIGVGAAFAPGADGYAPGRIHMVAGDAGYVGLVRTECGGLNVAGALDPSWVRDHGGPAPAVQAHLRAAGAPELPAEPVEGWRGTPVLTRRPARLAGSRFFRVGDAAGYVEPFTGEGMAWALAGAQALAPLLQAGVRQWSPALEAEWARAHARVVGGRQRICRGIAWLSRRPRWGRVALSVLARAPWLAAPLTAGISRPSLTPLYAAGGPTS